MSVNVKTDAEYRTELEERASAALYIPSDSVTEARARLDAVAAGKPDGFENQHAEQLGGLYSSILNREAYGYSAARDQTYLQYRDQYQALARQGARAADSMAGVLSGGYGNTWSAAVSGQIYGEQLKGLNDIVPALEKGAYSAYQANGAVMNAKLSTAVNRENTEYDRQKDAYGAWQKDRAFAAGRLDAEADRDAARYRDDLSTALSIIGYQREDAQTVRSSAYDWALEMLQKGVMPLQSVLDQAGISQADAMAIYEKYCGGSGGGGKKKKKKGRRRSGGTQSAAVDVVSGAARSNS